jgi:hypothetical protein
MQLRYGNCQHDENKFLDGKHEKDVVFCTHQAQFGGKVRTKAFRFKQNQGDV